jgi:hypothetical protein
MKPKCPKFVRIAVLAVLAVFTNRFASAQDPSSSVPQDGNSAPSSAGSVQSSDKFGGPPKAAGRVYMALGTDRLFSLNPLVKSQLLFEMDFRQGYDDGILLFPTQTGLYYTLWTPRVALLGRTAKSEYLVQYTPTLSYFANAPPVGFRAFQQATAELHTEVSREWGWDTALDVQNGSYPVKLLSGLSFVSLGDVSAVSIDSILLLSTASYFSSDASIGLHWQPSPKDRLVVATDYTYANFPPNNIPNSPTGHLHRDSVTADYTHSVSPRLSLLVNGNEVHLFGPLACTTYGGELGASYEIRHDTKISGSVGPEFGTAGCSGSVTIEYAGYLTSRLSREWEGYVGVERTTTGQLHSVLGNDLQETYGAGIKRQFSPRLDARLDAGYIRVKSMAALSTSFDAQGKFASGQVDWTLAPPIQLIFRYSRIYQNVSSFGLNRNQASVALEWRPNPRSAF